MTCGWFFQRISSYLRGMAKRAAMPRALRRHLAALPRPGALYEWAVAPLGAVRMTDSDSQAVFPESSLPPGEWGIFPQELSTRGKVRY